MAVVTCVGLAVQDSVYSIDGPLAVGRKNFATGMQRMGGGPAANAAVTVASLGGTANFISVLGHDPTADEIIEGLESRGVSTSRVRRNGDSDSPQSVVITTSDGERTIVNRTDRLLWDGAAPVSATDIEGSTCVLVDLRWIEGATSAIRQAADAGIPTVVDYDLTDGDAPESILELSSHVIFSEPAVSQLTGLTDPVAAIEALQTGSGFAGVTLGPAGVVWREDGQTHHFEAFDVDAVSTLGAGDVFHGAFALGVAQGRETRDNMRWSAAAAALTCQNGGGRAGIPTGPDVNFFLEEDGR
jgi:sulfofructose kinase